MEPDIEVIDDSAVMATGVDPQLGDASSSAAPQANQFFLQPHRPLFRRPPRRLLLYRPLFRLAPRRLLRAAVPAQRSRPAYEDRSGV